MTRHEFEDSEFQGVESTNPTDFMQNPNKMINTSTVMFQCKQCYVFCYLQLRTGKPTAILYNAKESFIAGHCTYQSK